MDIGSPLCGLLIFRLARIACAGRISTDAVLARQGGEIFRDRQAARDRDETEWNRGWRRQSEKKACRANV